LVLALQGTLSGLAVHAMGGFDEARPIASAGPPEGVEPQAVIAVDHHARAEDLPGKLRTPQAPNDRRPVEAWAFEGRWGG
jgi:hypothetical protein